MKEVMVGVASGYRQKLNRTKPLIFYVVIAVLFGTCSKENSAPKMFSLVKDSGIDFRNDVKDSKEDNGFLFRNFYNGGGVAIGDINNDSLPDVLLTSNQGENKLYLNKGGFKFEDISLSSGMKQDSMWSTGVAMADVNADGWLDIYICNSGNMQSGRRRNKLYINQHNATFSEESAKYGLDISGYCTQSSFFDYDSDGDLDCFVINNSPIPFSSLDYAGMRDVEIAKWDVDEKLKGGGNHLYRNDSGRFSEVTAAAGLHTGLISFGLGISVGDINSDGYPDVYVGNDFIEKDYLYINQKDGTFKDELEQRVQKISMSSMSTDLADINNDGHPEIFTTDMIPEDDYRLKTTGTFDNIDLYQSKQKAGLYHQYVRNCLQLNRGDGSFSEIGNYANVFGTDWSWASVFFDADNDGLNDIFVCNGIAKDVGDLDFLDFFSGEIVSDMTAGGQRPELKEVLDRIPVHALSNAGFRNMGGLRFEDKAEEWGLSEPSFSNGAAYGDLDGDGDLDLVVNNENQPAFVYRNNARSLQTRGGTKSFNNNAYIGIQLRAASPNTFAVGSKIKVYKGGQVFYRELIPSRGFQSSMDYKQIIGLGAATSVDSMVVIWPDRTYTKYNAPALNKVHYLEQPSASGIQAYYGRSAAVGSASQLSLLQALSTTPFDKHAEDDYIDLYYERNLPRMLSREGPQAAKGDVNGDGLEDVYIGGAKGSPGSLYFQGAGGSFVKQQQSVFVQYQDLEDVAVLFFDADKDRDLDLFIGAGGNNVQPGNREIQHRLYLNNGRGIFAIDTKAFGPNDMNISVAAAADYDSDGDQDLFVGGRSVPYGYGQVPQSYLYQNDGKGHFRDVAPPQLSAAGMVTAAVWADVAGDGKAELIVTGEWMETRIFSFSNNSFTELKGRGGLEGLYGWWQSLSAADLNGDGLQDLVIGNIGENFYLRPSASAPVKLWMSDFDGSGTAEGFLTRTVGGRDVPVFLKREITEQFPGLKKDNLKHSDYAKKSIQELFKGEVLGKSRQLLFNYCSSVVAINIGGGKFRVEALPLMVQLSSVNAICVSDVNSDGRVDLVLGGNVFGFPPQFGRLDASYGHLLMGRGEGKFSYSDTRSSGLFARGEVRDIEEIRGAKNTQRQYLFTQNNDHTLLYKINTK